MNLNQDQTQGVSKFIEFLFSPQKYFHIKGAAGTGKTFLMKYMSTEAMKQYENTAALLNVTPSVHECIFTATTNKAADVLSTTLGEPASTIYSKLGLKVYDDYSTGDTVVMPSNKLINIPPRSLIYVDESPMVGSALYKYVNDLTPECKVIWVGDHNQLAPVGERISPIYMDASVQSAELKTPVRNADQPALMALCEQFRYTVETGKFFPIEEVPGVIDVVDHALLPDAMKWMFQDSGLSCKVTAYTNDRVHEYNHFCLEMDHYDPAILKRGQVVILNQALHASSGLNDAFLSTESQHQIHYVDMKKTEIFGGVDCYVAYTITGVAMFVPFDPRKRDQILAMHKRNKNWPLYFEIKNNVADLRPHYASTTHKNQGSTYDVVLVDLEDIGSCYDQDMAARLLYVALSRPRTRVLLYGDLPARYGGPVRRA